MWRFWWGGGFTGNSSTCVPAGVGAHIEARADEHGNGKLRQDVMAGLDRVATLQLPAGFVSQVRNYSDVDAFMA